jgi:hypothetical protein
MDMKQFFAQIVAIKPIDEILETIIRRSIKTRPDDEWRIRAWIKRYRCDHASGFAFMFKKQFERIPHWDCVDVEEKLNWASVDVTCEEQVGELHCLLQAPSPRRHRERL